MPVHQASRIIKSATQTIDVVDTFRVQDVYTINY